MFNAKCALLLALLVIGIIPIMLYAAEQQRTYIPIALTAPTPTAIPATPSVVPTVPTVTVQPTAATPGLPPPSFNNCQADPRAPEAPNRPITIVRVLKDTEVVVLQNVSSTTVSLAGWRMCSIRGNQEHIVISGSLAPGETRNFAYTGIGNIWNNTLQDDGALYNELGQLVSYWNDPNR
jgi:hypothetical protein